MATVKAGANPYLSPKAKVQQVWLFVHRWLGIALLIPMALLGLTGSALVWPAETELLVNPQRSVAASADPANITAAHIDAASEAMEAHGPITAALIGEPGYPLMLGTNPVAGPFMGLGPPTRMAAYIDPDNAEFLDSKRSTGDFMWYMHAIHGHLLLSGVGRPVVGFMGLFLIISAVTGLVVWWPGRKKIIAAMRWRRWEGKMLNIHRQSGVLLSLVLIVEAFTGAWISFPAFFTMIVEPGAEAAEGHSHGPRPAGEQKGAAAPPVSFSGAEWERTLDQAQSAYPGRPASIQAPATADGEWTFMMIGAKGPAEMHVPAVPGTGEIEIGYRAQSAGRATKVAHVMDGIHAASIGGPIWQWLTFLSGIFLAFLSVSGLYVWSKRKLKRSRHGT
ncbi:PepSY-associated TM helix domain-containing protein [Pontixanthobacter aquaemixtae]|uniref:Iron-regulated membrane protein n=1 Tax=Pontixanthobacter aquaemixtae TaxID=1958940 RepID=A0A844ZUD7_9SPHN|nr:PepSY-associated TM helix domain-containing protein [Pontixanthobacter aquaemixtae]MXO90892.1 hypothetical protein [Pontixanthobacter aquaemixtae]